jgi:hypothetical protein
MRSRRLGPHKTTLAVRIGLLAVLACVLSGDRDPHLVGARATGCIEFSAGFLCFLSNAAIELPLLAHTLGRRYAHARHQKYRIT